MAVRVTTAQGDDIGSCDSSHKLPCAFVGIIYAFALPLSLALPRPVVKRMNRNRKIVSARKWQGNCLIPFDECGIHPRNFAEQNQCKRKNF